MKEHRLEPLARIVGYGGAAQAPEWFTTAPAVAIDKTLAKLGLERPTIDLYEINEAFAVRHHGLLREVRARSAAGQRPRRRGRARAPHRRERRAHADDAALRHGHGNAKRGLATLCIGGGEAVALVVER